MTAVFPTTEPTSTGATSVGATSVGALTYDRVTLDLYRDIHKGIRSELFAITGAAGSTDPGDPLARSALAGHVADVMALLVEHAHHEDTAIQPAIETALPDLAARIEADHTTLERRIAGLRDQASAIAVPGVGDERRALHRLYVELAAFTADYLIHQDVEERVVMPALEEAIGIEAVGAIHQSIVGPMPPDELARSLAVMLPAMNLDDRAELLGGIAAGAPAEVFDGIWNLVGTVLDPGDVTPLGARLGR